MKDAPHPAVAILRRALRTIAADWFYVKIVEQGSLHESQLLATMWNCARKAGIEANMVELTGSNHLLADRDLDMKPSGYWFRAKPYLQIDGQLLGISLSSPVGQSPRLLVHHYKKPGQARKAMGSPADFKWTNVNDEFENEVIQDFEMGGLQENLEALALDHACPPAPNFHKRPRL